MGAVSLAHFNFYKMEIEQWEKICKLHPQPPNECKQRKIRHMHCVGDILLRTGY